MQGGGGGGGKAEAGLSFNVACVSTHAISKLRPASALVDFVMSWLNPIALRKAKIAYNLGLSKCNRVNLVSFGS